MKFTKGEWFVYNEREIKSGEQTMAIESFFEGEDSHSVIIWQDSYGQNEEEELANAKLIAAAPRMFKDIVYVAVKDGYQWAYDLVADVLGVKEVSLEEMHNLYETIITETE